MEGKGDTTKCTSGPLVLLLTTCVFILLCTWKVLIWWLAQQNYSPIRLWSTTEASLYQSTVDLAPTWQQSAVISPLRSTCLHAAVSHVHRHGMNTVWELRFCARIVFGVSERYSNLLVVIYRPWNGFWGMNWVQPTHNIQGESSSNNITVFACQLQKHVKLHQCIK